MDGTSGRRSVRAVLRPIGRTWFVGGWRGAASRHLACIVVVPVALVALLPSAMASAAGARSTTRHRRRFGGLVGAVALVVCLLGVLVAAGAAGAATSVTLTPLATGFPTPIGIDYYQPTNEMVMSVNFLGGQPNNFDLVDSNGKFSPFSSVSGLTDEVYIAAIRSSSCAGGFTPGDMYFGTGQPGVIAKLSGGGSTLTDPWVTLPNEGGLLRGGLFQDVYCVAGGDLIVTTTVGDVWRVSSNGAATELASNFGGSTLEGPTTVPNDSARYGPWAGQILVSDEGNGVIWSIDPTLGAVGRWDGGGVWGSAEGVHVVPANENFFGVDFGSATLQGAVAAQFTGVVGDIVLATENSGKLLDITWNGTSFQSYDLLTSDASTWEGTTFAPAGITPIPPSGPTISTVDPGGGPWTGGTNVTVNGSNFERGDTLCFYASAPPNSSPPIACTPATTVVSPTQITATAPALPSLGDVGQLYLGIERCCSGPSGTSVQDYTSTVPYVYFIPQVGVLVAHDPTQSATSGYYTCTATVLQSRNRAVVVTAGHCVSVPRTANRQRYFLSDFAFAPGYFGSLCTGGATSSADFFRCGTRDSPAPFPSGVWTAFKVATNDQWLCCGNHQLDYGFLDMNSTNGKPIQDVVGGLPPTFNATRGQSWTAFGQPADQGFLLVCSGTETPSSLLEQNGHVDHVGPRAMSIQCQFPGGASGGPWINSQNGQTNGVGGVNSDICQSTLCAAFLGSEAQGTFRAMESQPVP